MPVLVIKYRLRKSVKAYACVELMLCLQLILTVVIVMGGQVKMLVGDNRNFKFCTSRSPVKVTGHAMFCGLALKRLIFLRIGV